MLEDLGLAASLDALCEEFSQRYGPLDVRFQQSGVPTVLPAEIASCAYRIAQESLWNAAKHAGAKHVKVTLQGLKDNLLLRVEDDGVGFDQESIRSKGGLGLVSMRERARVVNGTLSIGSAIGEATRVILTVPVNGGS